MNGHYNRLRGLSAILIGFTFVLSGTFKLMDPIGTSLIVSEYWNFFHLAFMKWSSYLLGIVLALTETILGVALVTGQARRLCALITFAMMGFFTLLTAVLAIFNPSFDCGCFGEVVHLTHAQTFVKNLVLDALALVAFLPLRDFSVPKPRKKVAFAIGSLSSVALLVYSMFFLPIKDYTDFKPGSQILASRTEAESTVFQASFVYERDGVEKVFTLEDDLPDTSWTFVRTETVGAADKASDLSFRDLETGEYLDSLAARGNVLIVSYFRNRHGEDMTEKAHRLLWEAQSLGYTPICLSAVSYSGSEMHDHPSDFCYGSDRRTLLALNRSNGGVTLLQDGLVIRKWSRFHYPSIDKLKGYAEGEPLETLADTQSHSNAVQQSYLLYIFTVLLLL